MKTLDLLHLKRNCNYWPATYSRLREDQWSFGVCAKRPSDIGVLKDKPGGKVSQVSNFPVA